MHAMGQICLMVETKGAAGNRWRSFREFILDSAVENVSFRFNEARSQTC
jgi:hypothetical protein